MESVSIEVTLTESASALAAERGLSNSSLSLPPNATMPVVGDHVGLPIDNAFVMFKVTLRRFFFHPEKPKLQLILDRIVQQ